MAEKEFTPEQLKQMEQFVREREPNMDYAFMNKLLIFSKHLLKKLDENNIKL